MSYDLMVFDPSLAPNDKDEFVIWYQREADRNIDYDTNDPVNCSDALRGWFGDMIKEFPPLNGPLAYDFELNDEEPSEVSDYEIRREYIYICFAWSIAEKAYARSLSLAQKHDIGFFDVSGNDSDIVFPGKSPQEPDSATRAKSMFDEVVERLFRIKK